MRFSHLNRKNENQPKKFKIISPEGEIYEGKSIRSFCKEHNLNPISISKMLRNKKKQHKGWTKSSENENRPLPADDSLS